MNDSAFHQSAQKIIKGDLPNVRKSIMLGLGGSGIRGINSAKQYIEKNMPREARRYMRWVGIDTTDIGTSIEGQGGSYRFPGKNQFFQDEDRTLYIGAPTPSELSVEYLRKIRNEDEAYFWLPDPDVYTISTRAGQGANQTRPLGRLAFFHNYERIRTALEKERDALMSLSNNPRYFQLMDIQEKSGETVEDVVVRPTAGTNRYYLALNIPSHHEITGMQMDETARTLLCPNVPVDKIVPSIFPRDERGIYFEISPEAAGGRELHFVIRHAPREAAISIFLTGSVVGGTGNGMFLDMTALIHDIFSEVWPKPKIYGVIVLPSAFKRVVYNRNARANAYAALKEFDYFLSGNPFRAVYPGGHETIIENRLFDDGMLYLLDVENKSGNVLQDRDQVQELTGQFIYSFVASSAGGAIEERMVNDSSRASIYLPDKGDEPRRRASYNSFGISRVVYPAPLLRDLGYGLVSLKVLNSFRRPADPTLLFETFGNLNRGLVRALRLNCKLIFDRMYPDYQLDWRSEFASYKKKIQKALSKRDARETASALEVLNRDYGRGEMDRLKDRLLKRMEARWRIELDKMEQILNRAVEKVTRDPGRGFMFCRALLEMVMDKLEAYQKVYYEKRVGLEYFRDEEIAELINQIDGGDLKPKKAEAVLYMVRINYLQLIYESMLQASEDFIREFKSLLYRIKNDTIAPLEDKMNTLASDLQSEIQEKHFVLLKKVNPLYFYLVNKDEIQNFINSYFAKRLSIEDLCNEADFLKMDRGDDIQQLIESYLIGKHGLEILEKSPEELKSFVIQELGPEIYEQSQEEVMERLFGEGQDEENLTISDSTMNRIEVENLRRGLYRIIHKRFEGFNFENISIQKLLNDRKIPIKSVFEKLDAYSQPYTSANLSGLKSMEYFRSITQFQLNIFEEGDVAPEKGTNDLPARMDHYAKRQIAEPNISVETFVLPNLCKPYEMLSMGLVLGFPLYSVDALRDSAADYHDLVSERSHPMHLFNHPSFDARYFPDPFRDRNYLNPRHLWEGLVHYGLLKKGEDEMYHYDKSLHRELRAQAAREAYYETVSRIMEKVEAGGGIRKCSLSLYVRVVTALGMLRKSGKTGKLFFRKDYDRVLRDILDGDGTGSRATESGLSKDEYIEKNIPSPEFPDLKALAIFLQKNTSCRDFLDSDIERIFALTRGNVVSGAGVNLPESKVRNAALPVFKDEFDYYDYFETKGSLEWQNMLQGELRKAVEKEVRRFRHPDDPTLFDRRRIQEHLESLRGKLPFIVAWEVMVNTGVIK